ncbi:MAG: hypothetical protein ABIN91_08250 [Mucilaginibacter sp.]|uniref:hypothetical protein n=1 Tax=Mucilaginibacter sp. TaxID=1882438 RepID=UPI003265F5CB
MLTKSATFQLNTDGLLRDISITPLFFKSENESWRPNEIYELTEGETEPQSLGKIIVDDHMDWRYEGDHGLSEEEIEQLARFVFLQI